MHTFKIEGSFVNKPILTVNGEVVDFHHVSAIHYPSETCSDGSVLPEHTSLNFSVAKKIGNLEAHTSYRVKANVDGSLTLETVDKEEAEAAKKAVKRKPKTKKMPKEGTPKEEQEETPEEESTEDESTEGAKDTKCPECGTPMKDGKCPKCAKAKADNTSTVALLNKLRAGEITAALQYELFSVVVPSLYMPGLEEIFSSHEGDEWDHSSALAQRIHELDGTPVTDLNEIASIAPFKISKDVSAQAMVATIREQEVIAVNDYKAAIAQCQNDPTTRLMLEQILTAEEEHLTDMKSMLEGNKSKANIGDSMESRMCSCCASAPCVGRAKCSKAVKAGLQDGPCTCLDMLDSPPIPVGVNAAWVKLLNYERQ